LLSVTVCEELDNELSNPHVGGIPVELRMPKEVDCYVWQADRMGGRNKTKWHFASLGKPFRQSGDEIGSLKYVTHSNEMRNDQAHLAFDARSSRPPLRHAPILRPRAYMLSSRIY
jgi:hypothetical protein